MTRQLTRLLLAWLLATGVLSLAGCDGPPTGTRPALPKVTVTPAVEREVLDSVEFQGRTEAVETVEVRSRTTGYLAKVNFRPDTAVEVGDVLFEIDPRIYQAEYERADGQVAVLEAKVKRLNGDVERDAPLVAKKTVTRQHFEKMVEDRDEAAADLKVAKANREGARVNLDFTKVKAPINGRVGRNRITVGDQVRADSTVLTNIVSTGKMYAYFDVDENTYLRYAEQERQRKTKPGEGRQELTEMTLGDGTVVTGGAVDYIDVQLRRGTGTIEFRATFRDPDGMLEAGQFVRVRLPIGDPHKALVVPEVAVASDHELKYVYVVDDHNKVAYRRVSTGTVHDGWQVIDKGLNADELVIVKGLLWVRDGMTVETERCGVNDQPAG